jgi:UDP-glucose-4-epimerase GalE
MWKSQVEAVIHFAAFAYVGESVEKPLKYYDNNVVGSIRLLQAMVEVGVKKLVFSSTCAVYGEPESVPIGEESAKQPVSPYGKSKLMVEHILEDCASADGLGSVALRYFNVAGADADGELGEDHRPETHLIPLAVAAALGKREELQLFGEDYSTPDGTCIRDYIHVDDLARAHIAALDSVEESRFLPLNLGIGKGFSVREVISAVERVSGKKVPLRVVSRRPGDPPALFAAPEKAMKLLGWKPQFTELDEIVRTAYEWFVNHPEGYKE